MMDRLLRTSLLVGAAVLLPACIEADVETEVKADGSGAFGVSMKFTEKFVEIARKLEKLDPRQGALKGMNDALLEKPDAASMAALEKKGLTLQEFESWNDEKRLGMKVRVGFKTLGSLTDFDSVMEKKGRKKGPAGSPADDITLVRNENGTYTLTLGMKSDPSGAAANESEEPAEAAGEDEAGEKGEGKEGKEGKEEEPSPEEAAKKMQEMMPLMGEMMGEAQKLRISIALKVPGEVVEFSPASGGKKEDGKVTWSFDFQTMMAAAMGGEENPMEAMSVTFRMPEGTTLPESALWKGKERKAADGPVSTPPAKEDAPAGEPK